ncbi:hypothetical protein L598_000700001190 [Mesorhizobium sp. J18]|uniref:hypothetical protein n=1 Tax=Mesorhizobium sp. J18 TaxID=935263 RepID=UPI00119BEBBA|nr:hypothetical protein [Mesorhizobium sp. J18]TWG90362.1 hypothetical protein L598_000700001190 [Mesorhizobium sp. J18]
MRQVENFLSLAKTQRRFAHQYRRWALEDEAAGKADRSRKYRAESQRLWEAAKFYLARARMFQH